MGRGDDCGHGSGGYMAMRFVTLVRLRTLLLIGATAALLGLMVYAILAQAWREAFEREAQAAAHSVAAALEVRPLEPDFMCNHLPLGNIQWISIETQRGLPVFESNTCPFMRDAQPYEHVIVGRASVRTAQGDSVLVEAAVWDPVLDRLALDIVVYLCVLCATVFAFLFVLSAAVDQRYTAGIRSVVNQTQPVLASQGKHLPTSEELQDLSHMLQIVRESTERDIQASRDTRASEAYHHCPLSATWNAGPYTLCAVRVLTLDESGLVWAWLHDTSLHVLLARFTDTPAENSSDLGHVWRQAIIDGQPEELDSILAAFAPEGYHYCVFEGGLMTPRTVGIYAMAGARVVSDTEILMTSAADSKSPAAGTWLIVRSTSQAAPATSDLGRQS